MAKKKEQTQLDGRGAPTRTLANALNSSGKVVDRIYGDLEASAQALCATKRQSYSKTGLMAEMLHEAIFNIAAAEAGRGEVRAQLTKPGHPTSDITIKNSRTGKAKSYQAKYCKDAAATYRALSQKKYEGQNLLTPADQLHEVVDLARKGSTPTSAARRRTTRAPAAEEFMAALEMDGIKGKAVPYKEAQRCAEGKLDGIRKRRQRAAMRHSVVSSMKGAAAVGGVVSAARHAGKVRRKEESLVQATQRVVQETLTATAVGGASAAGTKLIEQCVTKATGKTVGRLGSAGAFTVVTTVLTLLRRAVRGELTWAVAAEEIAEATAGLSGAELGMVLGTAIAPGAGTAIGGLVGGFAGQFLMQRLIRRIQARQRKLAVVPATAGVPRGSRPASLAAEISAPKLQTAA
ncbi:hypothetical protein GO300_03826 [Ralstonia solanacearum]|nr:hypothetical protein [Ralstonia solanacearum]